MPDLQIKCADCPKVFIHTEGAQKFYEEKGFDPPKRCKECREKKKNRFVEKT